MSSYLHDHFDHLPDSILLLILNKIGDVKSLGRCTLVSKRFLSLIPQVENVVVRIDCVISDQDSSSSLNTDNNKTRSLSPFSAFFRLVLKPLQAIGLLLTSKRGSGPSSSSVSIEEEDGVTHHSPTQVLKNFEEIKFLKIELPSGELGVDDGVLLKWKAEFGSTLESCVILGASSVTKSLEIPPVIDDGVIPDGGLKLRVVWTISSLIAASARHYLLQGIIKEHKVLDSLVLSDVDGQGVVVMNREQLEELRVKPLCASSASKRTLVPALNMRLWYAPSLELGDGTVLNGATLVAIRPSELKKDGVCDVGELVCNAFGESFYGVAAKMLVKRRTYCLEMNSF